MSEPTAEQVDRERTLTCGILCALGLVLIEPDMTIIATAMARVRIEAHAVFEQALAAKAGDTVAGYFLVRKAVSNGCFGWWVSGPGVGAEGFISLPNLIAAIRALRGRT